MEFFEAARTGTWHAYSKRARAANPARPKFDLSIFRTLHQLAAFKPLPGARRSRFVDHLAIYLPEVAATMGEDDFGVLHLEVGALKLATRDAIVRRDWPVVRRHFAFVDSLLEHADTELHDAIGVSYLGNLFYSETALDYAKARTLLPPRLAVALEIMERHYEDLAR